MGKMRLSVFTAILLILGLAGCNAIPLPSLSSLKKPTVTPQIPITAKSSQSSASSPQKPGDTPTPPPTDDTSMGGMAMDTPSANSAQMIKVSDQPLNRGAIVVDEVITAEPAWVVIYTTNASGQPDQPIGHTAVKPGDNRNVKVDLDASKVTGTLYAQIHVDKGVIGTFEFPGPDEPLMSGVQMIASTFKVQNNDSTADKPTPSGPTPGIIVANQPIVDGKITIPEVVSVGNAWIVVHRQNGDGTMGSMVGYTRVQDGVNKNVVIALDTKSTSAVMYAMLHEDNAKLASPQFPGVDVPIMINGQMISPTFEITQNGVADLLISVGDKPETINSLVDNNDMSLYVSLQDTPGKSNCNEECAKTWRPLLATGKLIAGNGVNAKALGVILLPNGSRQVTYLGAPLYLYSKDEKPGDVNGQGLDGSWYLVNP
jgi:predicted lipoprotein with Yx(FWY)xxD motif